VDLKLTRNPESSTHSLTLEYEFPDKWVLVNMAIKREDGASRPAKGASPESHRGGTCFSPSSGKPPTNPPKATPQSPQQYFDPKTGVLHFDHNYRLTIDGKPWDGQPL
jgi:hypothetical protein